MFKVSTYAVIIKKIQAQYNYTNAAKNLFTIYIAYFL
jgi:hypothetical protein